MDSLDNARMVACPFCGWHRYQDTSKQGASWNPTEAAELLMQHLHQQHQETWREFLALHDRVQDGQSDD